MRHIKKHKMVVRFALALAVIGIAMLVSAPPVAAAGTVDPALQPLVDYMPTMFIVGMICLLLAGLLYWLEVAELLMIALAIIGGLLMILATAGFLISLMAAPSGGGGGGGGGVYSADWDCEFIALAAGGPGGAHDAATEFPDSPFTAADGGTPDLDKTIGASLVYDYANNKVTWNIDVDDDQTTTEAAWLDEDAYNFDIRCKLLNGMPSATGSNTEIPAWGHIDVTRTAGTRDNGSFARVFYGDSTAGEYLGFGLLADSGAAADGHDADHTYVSYTGQKPYPAAGPLSGDWIALGTSDADPDGEWFSCWIVLDSGLSDYSSPTIDTGVTVTVSIGTSPMQTQWKGDIDTLTIYMNIDTRT